MKRIRVTSKSQPRIRDSGPGQPLVNPLLVAKALGAEIVSTGGRPGFAMETFFRKVSIAKEDWEKLVKIASASSTTDRRVSPGQVAAILLREALRDEEGPSPEQVERWLHDHRPWAAYNVAMSPLDILSGTS